MLADSVPTAPSVALASDVLRKGEQRYALLDFIAEQLPCWRAADAAVLEQAEDRLTMQLSDFLEEAADGSDVWNRVRFKTQRPDAVNKKGTLDIVAKPVGTIIFAERTYTRRAVLLAIECKRLPAPKPKAREKEYVTSIKGATGGIQRFKLGKHAADHNLAAIIGYVQKGQPADWIATINGWITALASVSSSGWTNDDCLVLDEDGGELCRLTSRHDRGAGKVRIELRHLWIHLN